MLGVVIPQLAWPHTLSSLNNSLKEARLQHSVVSGDPVVDSILPSLASISPHTVCGDRQKMVELE